MIRILFCFILGFSCHSLIAQPTLYLGSNNLTPCISMKEVEPIGKQINELFQQKFCEEKVDPKKIASIAQNVLQKIMTESFLTVTPPPNWQLLTNEILENCIKNNDLCKKEFQKEFEACIQLRTPLILLQFGPWLVEHCSQLKKSLIQNWPNKNAILKKIIHESKVQNNAF